MGSNARPKMYLELKDVQVPKKAEKRVGLDPEKERFSGKGGTGVSKTSQSRECTTGAQRLSALVLSAS